MDDFLFYNKNSIFGASCPKPGCRDSSSLEAGRGSPLVLRLIKED